MTIKVVTFDLDDTLWDVTPPLLKAEKSQNDWLRLNRSNVSPNLEEKKLFNFKKRIWKQYPELQYDVSAMRQKVLEELQLESGYSKELSTSGAKKAFDVFHRERCSVELYPDVLETVSKLRDNFVLGALTNGNADIFLTDAGAYFSFAFRAEEVGAAKPSPELFEAAKNFAGVNYDEIAHVGDDPIGDIKGAKIKGARAIWINRSSLPWKGEVPPDKEIKSLRELPKVLSCMH